MKLIDISTRKHPNTFTMVDDADFDWLNQWKWYLRGKRYVVRGKWENGKCRIIYMHREILKPPAGMLCDHRFGDTLDNRRENLRICTIAENARNRQQRVGRKLPKGVRWRHRDRRFQSRIMVDSRAIHLGYFRTVIEAVKAYNEAAIKYHGEFSCLTECL